MHHPGFSCPLCRTFADLEADVEQEDVEMADGEADSSSGESPDPPPKDTLKADDHLQLQSYSIARSSSEIPRSSSQSNVRSRASRRSSVASRRFNDMQVPDAGDFQQEMRRSSIHVSGPHGQASPFAITGRSSRPPSVRNLDMQSNQPSPSPKVPHDHYHHSLLASPPDTAVGASTGAFTAADALAPSVPFLSAPQMQDRSDTLDVFGFRADAPAQSGLLAGSSRSGEDSDESRQSSDSLIAPDEIVSNKKSPMVEG